MTWKDWWMSVDKGALVKAVGLVLLGWAIAAVVYH